MVNTPLADEVAEGVWQIRLPHPSRASAQPFVISCYVVRGEERSVLIDAGFRDHDAALHAAVGHVLGHDPRLTAVLVTHGHPDHAGGAAALQRAFSADIVMHRADAQSRRDLASYLGSGWDLAAAHAPSSEAHATRSRFIEKHDELAGAVRAVDGGYTVDLGDRRLAALHTPGHTPGSVSWLLEPPGVVFTGDAAQGWGGLHGVPFYCRPDDYVTSIGHLRDQNTTALCSAHPYAWRSHPLGSTCVMRGEEVEQFLRDSLTFHKAIESAMLAEPSLAQTDPATLFAAAGFTFDGSAASTLTAQGYQHRARDASHQQPPSRGVNDL